MANTIKVKATRNDNKVVIWESHPDHPTGEIFIIGDGRTHNVAETIEVKKRITDRSLEQVFNPSATKSPEKSGDKKGSK